MPGAIASTAGRTTFDLDGDGDFDWLFHTPWEIVWEENVNRQGIDILVGEGDVGLEHPVDIALLKLCIA